MPLERFYATLGVGVEQLVSAELEALGIRGDNGLELIIHDGGSGLCAALNIVHFGAAEQRCLFHKLRNLYNAIRVTDDSLSHKEQRRQRKAIFRDFHHIWEAKQRTTALRRLLRVVRRYRTTQPEAVRCLRSDFRTTSRLERFNRSLRRRTRAAAAYHSDTALHAMLRYQVEAFNSDIRHP